MTPRPPSAADAADGGLAVVTVPEQPVVGVLVRRQDGDDSADTWSRSSASSSEWSVGGGGEVSETVAPHAAVLQSSPGSFGDIAVENSSEVYIGSTHFHGAVTLVVSPSTLPAVLPAADQRLHLPVEVQPVVVGPGETVTAAAPGQPSASKFRLHRLFSALSARIAAVAVVLAVLTCIALVIKMPQLSRGEGEDVPSTATFTSSVQTPRTTSPSSRTPHSTTAAAASAGNASANNEHPSPSRRPGSYSPANSYGNNWGSGTSQVTSVTFNGKPVSPDVWGHYYPRGRGTLPSLGGVID